MPVASTRCRRSERLDTVTDDGPNMELRALIAVLLSLVVMVAFQYLYAPQPQSPTAEPQREGVAADGQPADPEGLRAPDDPSDRAEAAVPSERAPRRADGEPAETGAGDASSGEEATAGQERDPVVSVPETAVAADAERRLVVETERLTITLTNRGARLLSARLNRYEADDGAPVELVVQRFAATGRLPFDLVTPERPELARAANEALYVTEVSGGAEEDGILRPTEDDPVVVRFRWADPGVGAVVKELELGTGDLQALEVRAGFAAETPTFVALGPGLEEGGGSGSSGYGYLTSGAVIHRNGEPEHWASDDLEEPTRLEGDTRWAGQESNYFLALLVPNGVAEAYLYTEVVEVPAGAAGAGGGGDVPDATDGQGDGAAGAGATEAEPTELRATRVALRVPDGGLATPMYLGPKDYNRLERLGYDLHEVVDFGFFAILAIPLYEALSWTYQYVHNYGLAIILLTIVIKILFLPLTHKSFVSMQRMRELQPKMNAIKSKYKGKKDLEARQEMNQEVMELYKKEGVSPFGGCMPMLLQIPVLFAFYAVLSLAIELRHAPFVLWIDDLSKADPYWILPILMGASMYAQQNMSPSPTADPMQARMFKFLPVFMTALFVTLPSGLVLYWFVNNLLGVGQQAYIQRRLNPEPDDSKGQPTKAKKGRKGKRGKK